MLHVLHSPLMSGFADNFMDISEGLHPLLWVCPTVILPN